jgi:hypothetical protein
MEENLQNVLYSTIKVKAGEFLIRLFDREQFADYDVEYVLRVVPPLIFLVFAYMRFRFIRGIGFSKTLTYSRFFLTKLILQYIQAVFEAVAMILFLTGFGYLKQRESGSYSHLFALLGLINVIAWAISGKFLAYEYRKRLSEGVLTHQLFWITTFLVDLWVAFANFHYLVSPSTMTITPIFL